MIGSDRGRLGFESGAQPIDGALDSLEKVNGGFPPEFVFGFGPIQRHGGQLAVVVRGVAGWRRPAEDRRNQAAHFCNCGLLPGADVVASRERPMSKPLLKFVITLASPCEFCCGP